MPLAPVMQWSDERPVDPLTLVVHLDENGEATITEDDVDNGSYDNCGIAEYSVAQRDSYSIVDLRAGIGGENWTLTAFATNLTDEKYVEEIIPAPEFGGTFDHPGTQRRYGLELSYRF